MLCEGFFSESKFKKFIIRNTNLKGVDFFKTPLKGIDLSECMIENISVSDSFWELKGVKISPIQAIDLVQTLGVAFV